MTNHKTYHASRLSNWFLIAAFVLSVFSFSGYVGNDKTQLKTTQTEFVSSYKTKKVRRTLSLTKAFAFVYSEIPPLSILGYETHFLIAFNRLIKTQIDHSTKQCLSFKSIEQLHIKTIPQSTNEDIASALLG